MRWTLAVLLLIGASPAAGQVDGHVSLLVDFLPDVDDRAGNQTATEARVSLFLERKQDVGEHFRLNLSGAVDAVLASRPSSEATVRDALFRPLDLYAEWIDSRFEIRAGASRLVWGRLDEFQPTDVVNPLDLARFLLEGRSEARLAVGLVRGRLFLPASTTIELVMVPAFRAATFDELDEETSPFRLTVPLPSAPTREKPDVSWKNAQGGGRLTSTLARVDWGVSAYRGFKSFPTVTIVPIGPRTFRVLERYPRFTMIGGDFETVRGSWGLRGEVALFVDDELQSTRAARGVPGRSAQGGIGVDRRAGDYRVAGNVIVSHQAPNEVDSVGAMFDEVGRVLISGPADDEEVERTDVMFVAAVDRTFARDTRRLRIFTVYDPADETMFARAIGAISLRDNLWLEVSGGLFTGSSPDVIGRLTRRDFVYGRLKVFF